MAMDTVKFSDFCADKHEEHSQYTHSLASILSYEQQSPKMIKLASDALNLLQGCDLHSTTQHPWLQSGMVSCDLGGSVLLKCVQPSNILGCDQECLSCDSGESIDDDRTYKHHRSQSPNIENNQKENSMEVINNEQNLDEKRVGKELVKQYDLRERQEINYAEISSSDIDPYYLQVFDPLLNNLDFSVISLNRPIITKVIYNLISTHIICAFSSTLHLVRETINKSLFEKIEKLLRMRNKLILDKSITLKLKAIFQTDYVEISLKYTLLDFIAMYKYMSSKVNAFFEIRYEWIEKDVKSIRDTRNMFTINIKTWKTNLLVLRLSDTTEILYVEVSGPPYKPEKKHIVGDAKKLLMMAFIRNEFIEQEKLLEKICSFVPLVDDNTSNLQEWVHLPDDYLMPVNEKEIDKLVLNDT
ncbi:8615_t:CDS:10 [Dentiscutata erythropus]|uniref:8615_t:CDS:1 n=1 Tax=Dentiscutata erythropus TaxID=1348616 RepID=A0A9N9FBH8_9GLOM|nr:8615_t:CDS:10 [Dentiscutata erythropus]